MSRVALLMVDPSGSEKLTIAVNYDDPEPAS
jgi:hypothetical protein